MTAEEIIALEEFLGKARTLQSRIDDAEQVCGMIDEGKTLQIRVGDSCFPLELRFSPEDDKALRQQVRAFVADQRQRYQNEFNQLRAP